MNVGASGFCWAWRSAASNATVSVSCDSGCGLSTRIVFHPYARYRASTSSVKAKAVLPWNEKNKGESTQKNKRQNIKRKRKKKQSKIHMDTEKAEETNDKENKGSDHQCWFCCHHKWQWGWIAWDEQLKSLPHSWCLNQHKQRGKKHKGTKEHNTGWREETRNKSASWPSIKHPSPTMTKMRLLKISKSGRLYKAAMWWLAIAKPTAAAKPEVEETHIRKESENKTARYKNMLFLVLSFICALPFSFTVLIVRYLSSFSWQECREKAGQQCGENADLVQVGLMKLRRLGWGKIRDGRAFLSLTAETAAAHEAKLEDNLPDEACNTEERKRDRLKELQGKPKKAP